MARDGAFRQVASNGCTHRDPFPMRTTTRVVQPLSYTTPEVGRHRPLRYLLLVGVTVALGAGLSLPGAARPASADTGSTSAPATNSVAPSAAAIVATAEQYVGSPYATIGDSPATGFSCIGFAHFVYAQHGIDVPENLAAAYASAPQIAQSQLQAGDLVFFQNTAWQGISHVAIYIGAGKMIGADSFQTGVRWDTLSDAYWQTHYLGATRPLANLTGAPVATPSPTPYLAVPDSPTATAVPAATTPAVTGLNTSRSAQPMQVGTIVTALGSVTVYSGPDDAYAGIDNIASGTPLTMVQTQGRWINVAYSDGNRIGWVYAPNLNLPEVTATQATNARGSSASSGATGGSGSSASQGNSATSQPAVGATLIVQRANAAVYSSPSSVSSILAMLTGGAHVTLLQQEGTWDRIALPDGGQGWIDAGALASMTVNSAGSSGGGAHYRRGTPYAHDQMGRGIGGGPTRTASDGRAVVIADVLFVRAGPARSASILRRVHSGDRVTILATAHGWDYVSLRDNSHGWVSAQWIGATNAT